MATVLGCYIPENLYYNVENNVWARLREDGLVVVGMTAYACSLSGVIVSFTAKKVGKQVGRDKSCATVESGKWVGPVKAPVSGEVVEINQEVSADPSLINDDPYGQGWLLLIRPEDWLAESVHLLTGEEAIRAYETRMQEDGFGGC